MDFGEEPKFFKEDAQHGIELQQKAGSAIYSDGENQQRNLSSNKILFGSDHENIGSILKTQMRSNIEGNIRERMSKFNAVIAQARQNNANLDADMEDHVFSETNSGNTVGAP
jgi:hypothetical protein